MTSISIMILLFFGIGCSSDSTETSATSGKTPHQQATNEPNFNDTKSDEIDSILEKLKMIPVDWDRFQFTNMNEFDSYEWEYFDGREIEYLGEINYPGPGGTCESTFCSPWEDIGIKPDDIDTILGGSNSDQRVIIIE